MTATRRTVLQGLAASPAALALPKVTQAATAAPTSPDAALIAQAENSLAMVLRREALWDRRSDLESKAEPIGLNAWHRRQKRLGARLQNAVADLRDVVPTTPAGLAIKARIAVAFDPNNEIGCLDWEDDFRAAVLRDAVALAAGGQANG